MVDDNGHWRSIDELEDAPERRPRRSRTDPRQRQGVPRNGTSPGSRRRCVHAQGRQRRARGRWPRGDRPGRERRRGGRRSSPRCVPSSSRSTSRCPRRTAWRRWRRSCDRPGARVLMCSALGQESKVIESIKLGAKDFVVKPFQSDRPARRRRQGAGLRLQFPGDGRLPVRSPHAQEPTHMTPRDASLRVKLLGSFGAVLTLTAVLGILLLHQLRRSVTARTRSGGSVPARRGRDPADRRRRATCGATRPTRWPAPARATPPPTSPRRSRHRGGAGTAAPDRVIGLQRQRGARTPGRGRRLRLLRHREPRWSAGWSRTVRRRPATSCWQHELHLRPAAGGGRQVDGDQRAQRRRGDGAQRLDLQRGDDRGADRARRGDRDRGAARVRDLTLAQAPRRRDPRPHRLAARPLHRRRAHRTGGALRRQPHPPL